jgi:hypothetical protein
MARNATAVVGIVALVTGLLIGSSQGGAETRRLRAELEETKATLEKELKKEESRLPMAQLNEFLRSSRTASREETAVEASAAPAVESSPGTAPDGVAEGTPVDEPKTPREAIDMMASTWRLRGSAARAAFVETAKLTKDQQESLNHVVEKMNDAVRTVFQNTMQDFDFSREPQARDMVDLGVALGEVYQDVDDELRKVLSEEQLEQALDAEFDIFTQIDPDVAMPFLIKLEESAPRARGEDQ